MPNQLTAPHMAKHIHGQNGTIPANLTNTWEELGAQLDELSGEFNAFRKLIWKPRLDFNYDYSEPKVYRRALISHLPPIKSANFWLRTSELYNLHFGKSSNACTDVHVMLAFVKCQTEDRFEISQLILFVISDIAASV